MNLPLHHQLALVGSFIVLASLACLAVEACSRLLARRREARQAKLQPVFDPIVIRRLSK